MPNSTGPGPASVLEITPLNDKYLPFYVLISNSWTLISVIQKCQHFICDNSYHEDKGVESQTTLGDHPQSLISPAKWTWISFCWWHWTFWMVPTQQEVHHPLDSSCWKWPSHGHFWHAGEAPSFEKYSNMATQRKTHLGTDQNLWLGTEFLAHEAGTKRISVKWLKHFKWSRNSLSLRDRSEFMTRGGVFGPRGWYKTNSSEMTKTFQVKLKYFSLKWSVLFFFLYIF